MTKNKIALKLSVYFAVALCVLAIIIGGIFISLFQRHTVELHKTDLAKRARSIALTLGECIDTGNDLLTMGNYGPYMHFIGDIAGTDVWIIDENLNLITGGARHSMLNQSYEYSDLPENAESIIQTVFGGEEVFSEEFSDILSSLTLTVGVPIKQSNGHVFGVVLVHSPVQGVNQAIANGVMLLVISIIVALVITFFISIRFSISFTKPLNKMKDTAMRLAEGDYCAKNEITQNDEVGQLAVTIDTLADRLEAASKQSAKLEQLRNDFIANVSHELKTPITVIRGSLEGLIDKIVSEPEHVKQYYTQMHKETIFLQRLVGDLLDLSKLQNTDFVIEKRDISMCEVVEDVIQNLTPIAEKKDVVITASIQRENDKIYADYGRIRQMLMIVLDNAVKFSPNGSAIEVSLKDRTLSIRDYGEGISSEDLPYVFERFYKISSEQNRAGTGLGLAIAKQIAIRHDVTISVESKLNQGTTFKFSY